MLLPAVRDLMDRMPEGPIVDQIAAAARSVEGVLDTEKLRVRKHGMEFFVDIHVQAEPTLSLFEAHVISGKVKHAIRAAAPAVAGVSVHMEPFERARSPGLI
jgi:divalent metal cation (Fe/Co/Zn/Cd) transporter